jgi:ABC-type nickel/cobalt efflux system permease component RcnA
LRSWTVLGPARCRLSHLVGGAPALVLLLMASPSDAHPLGNFSISHYAGLRVSHDVIEIRYVVDLAEIPTFQEIQEAGLTPETGHPSVTPYLTRKSEALKEGLVLELNGRRLTLSGDAPTVIFPPGAGGLPTMKIGVAYRATFDSAGATSPHTLRYRDLNFEGRAGWKEIVASAGTGIAVVESSVPERDRSRELSDYPTDLLNSPPQQLDAQLAFAVDPALRAPTRMAAAVGPPVRARDPVAAAKSGSNSGPREPARLREPAPPVGPPPSEPFGLQANRQKTPRTSFTELVRRKDMSAGILAVAAVVAFGVGALHALEPGHGKTIVAAYLVGSRGTAIHALFLGLVVTVSHTAAVYLLGAVTLAASRFIVPERLFPWLGVASGLTIAALGFALFLRRYAGDMHPHSHDHHHGHTHSHDDQHSDDHDHRRLGHRHAHDDRRLEGHRHQEPAPVSIAELMALGITGGIVPCPAALVVILSAIAVNRIGFGFFLIVAFSAGLAAVLITIGLLMVYARRFMSRLHGEGPLVTRWLPLASAAVVTVFGVAIAVQALLGAGILQIRL